MSRFHAHALIIFAQRTSIDQQQLSLLPRRAPGHWDLTKEDKANNGRRYDPRIDH
jgi:hypothetical protein